MNKSEWMVIVNPNACGGKVLTRWDEISRLLKAGGIDFKSEFTTHRYHAVELIIRALRLGYRKFVALGGDGTIHEIINGVFHQQSVSPADVTMAVIPVGSGNDWSRSNSIPFDLSQAINVISEGKTILQDVAKVSYVESGVSNVRYMINGAGVGLDANICRRCNIAKNNGNGGAGSYVKAAFSSLMFRRSVLTEVLVDGKRFFFGKMFSIAIGNGKYSGGGMIQVPDAVSYDGKLSVMVARRISKLKFLLLFRYLFNGKVYSIKEVSHTEGSVIEINSKYENRLEVDGEVVGTTPVKIEVIPQAINVVVR